jgi:hypothetical protein
MAHAHRLRIRQLVISFREGNLLLEELVDALHDLCAKGGDATTPPDTGT